MRASGRVVLLVLLAAASSARARAPERRSAGCRQQGPREARQVERSVEVDGLRRAYLVDVPSGRAAPAAVLLDFHGFGHNAAGLRQHSGFRSLTEQENLLTLYPDGLPVHLMNRDAPGWEIFQLEGNREVKFVRAMLEEVARDYCVDLSRVYATGFSNGAFLSHILGCVLADRIAAIAPVSGGDLTLSCLPSRPVPVLLHHGRGDPLIPVERARAARDRWVRWNGCRETRQEDGCEVHSACGGGAEVRYCEHDGVHQWPQEAFPRIWSFLRRFSLPGPEGR